ncbi:hypothetical protein AUEXF2481DRAFT_645625 [Aureobasidium subglaciale EXF-2481]|uniref:Thioesterase domain-containing protein n=1 Tax=Aureobasidium subglaciale (strain EXF-2481) TaxID=1043005 RepID=A0A074YKJ3_AURSE|nr:uncharacterized protein AUEXF2481DRAFT_645625 [Aureobasidium subglaciale EXF-2481]KAI5201098.1 hypothetical protein E4T38_06308 [Aureobasidium subglaciale]KAI5219670.1 hypothetical protein E4T40_06234 [Aureobasidium subglaciale]KAI5223402.1 hypothetical protein E4T41_06074 [Aureobasidium subglaciale]KAI5260448.1 hypothetical protein E4T46_06063 [Aureobasidium subglaciale]KEQ96579.1 hypothetical protein AUEXF2481DRAFT_645625 [Aureobasidium subglaciale EXF-2481]
MNNIRSNPTRSLQCVRQIRRASTLDSKPNKAPSLLRKYRGIILWTSIGLAVGGTTGTIVSHTIAPPPHPLPGTHEDGVLMQDLNTRIDSEFKVKVLRGKCTAVAASLRGDEGVWRELDPKTLHGSLVNDSLAGARSLGVQRVFWNEKEHELVAVVWFGGAMSGWPGVTHGGGIATVLADKMALAARLAKGIAPAQDSSVGPSEATRLDLAYKKPTYANAFYVVRAVPRYGAFESSSPSDMEVEAQLETLDGKVCVLVKGAVPVSEDESTIKSSIQSLTPAKSWLGWTSRSDT